MREDQGARSERFARAREDKWSGLDYETWDTGCPILTGTLASFECKIRQTYHGGDHGSWSARCCACGTPRKTGRCSSTAASIEGAGPNS